MSKQYKIFGEHEPNTIKQFEDVLAYPNSVAGALMADGHLGYIMPVGGVMAFDNKVMIAGVGYDIACGNCAIKTNLKLSDITHNQLTLSDIDANPSRVMGDKRLNEFAKEIQNKVSFGIGRSNQADDAPIDDPLFTDQAWFVLPNTAAQRAFRDELMDKARRQLGTVGSGNHYVDVFVDEEDTIWVGVHFGSRGLGHTIASSYLALAAGGTWGDKPVEIPTCVDLSQPLGQDYWALMELAGRYAYVGREWVTRKVVSILGGTELDMVHNHHNFAWKEKHWIDGAEREVVVVRKGATPAFPGQRGFIGGSMGENAVIVRGAPGLQPGYDGFDDTDARCLPNGDLLPIGELNDQTASLFSTIHGAGRVMSRTEAAGRVSRSGVVKKHGKVTHEMMQTWLESKGVILRGGGVDESPHVYKRLPEVLAHQGDTIEVQHTLRPIIVAMAGAKERDPYKD